MHFLLNLLRRMGSFHVFLLDSFTTLLKKPLYLSEILHETSSITLQCLLPVAIVLTPFGMVVALQGFNIFKIFGTEYMVSGLTFISLVRELSPGVTSIMIAAQAGSSISAELGAMRVKEEIDALEVMSIHSLKYLIIPKILGLSFACVIVNMISLMCGILGGYIVAVVMKGQSSGVYWDNLFIFASWFDPLFCSLKAFLYGLIIASLSSYYGYNVQGGAREVGIAVNRSVVNSILAFIFLNYFLTTLFFNIVQL